MTRKHSCFIAILLIMFVGINVHSQTNKLLRDSIPTNWEYNSEFSQTIPTEDKWWETFDDKCLDSLITMAVANNYDVLIAQKRITMAKNAVKIAQSKYYPNLSIDASWTKEHNNSATNDIYNLGLNFNWEIDLFGQITSQVKSKSSLWQASKAQYEGTLISLCANVAKSYINLRTWQMQYKVAMSHIESQKQILDMTEARFKSGLASMLDVSQARTIYLSTQSSITPLKANIETQINAIAILLGTYSNNLPQGLNTLTRMPNSYAIIPIGIPADLLRRRPDIKAAEYTVASYAAAIGVAKKDFLPTLSIDGTLGFKTDKINDLFNKNSFSYSFTPKLTWTLFEGLNRNYQLLNAKEQYQMGIDNYNNTTLNAIIETQNALIAYHYSLIETQELEKVTSEAYNSLQLSVDLYKRGLTNFTNVLTSQQNYLEYNNSLVASQGKSLQYLVAIYQALGGGWNINP